MTMQINIKDQFVEQFEAFVNSLPKNAIKIDNNTISFDQAKEKVSKALNNIPLNKGMDIDTAFEKAFKY